MKSSLHSLIPCFPFLLKTPEALNSIPLLPSSYPGRLASRNSTDSNDLLCPFYKSSALTKQKAQPFYCWESVFTAALHNNGSYPIVSCVFVAAGKCLTSSCLAMDVSSDFTIPAFGRHVYTYCNKYFNGYQNADSESTFSCTSLLFFIPKTVSNKNYVTQYNLYLMSEDHF
jgi:hypothetical protein